MAQQTTTTQYNPSDEFNTLLARAQGMVSALVAKSVTTGTYVQKVKDFQVEWNSARGLVIDELNVMIADTTRDPKNGLVVAPGSPADEVIQAGLQPDGKYGPKTTVALTYTLWARMGVVDLPQGIPVALGKAGVPSDPRMWPQTYANSRAFFDSLFLPVAIAHPQGPDPIPPPIQDAPKPPVPDVIAQQPVPSTQTGTEVVAFDTPTNVVGRDQGKSSLAPVVAIGAGVAVIGGLFWFAFGKKKRGR